jgi:6-phosphogluconolactonase
MAPGKMIVLADEAALARAVAANFVETAQAAISARGRFDVALSGGSTPRAMYALLAAPPLDGEVDWPAVRFFFGDERCVPPDDAESNYKTANDGLLAPLGIDATHVFRMRGEDDPAVAARAYAYLLRRELGPSPVFDLVLLGMGPDGHTASLFPGTDPLTDDEALVRAPWVTKFSTYRITLTPRVINAARHVAIAAGGAAKAAVLKEVREGPHDPTRHPIQIVAPKAGELTWFVDAAAASALVGSVKATQR